MSKQAEKIATILSENAIGEEEFAYCLGIEPALATAICLGKKKLSASLARQVEQTFSKPKQWLDSEEESGQGPNYDLFG
jgi:plasmid maintenance system antidote protein VapI